MSTNRNCKPILKRTVVDITDPKYFCNKSWTLSYNINTKSWVSFHSYIPNFYIAENNFFYSGLNSCCDDDISLDVISTVVLPPTPTTTTTSSSTSTTSSTTTKALDCALEGTTSIADCTLEGVAIEAPVPPEICKCYTLVNNNQYDIAYYSYKECGGGMVTDQELYISATTYICAVEGTVSFIGDVTVLGPFGDCTTAEICTPSTTSTTTTICPNCKTYTLINTTSFVKTATQLIDCETGLEYTKEVPANTTLHACSCNSPVVPTGLTKSEFGSGCTKCFCYELENIQGVDTYVGYTNCLGEYKQELVLAYSTSSVCAMDGTVQTTTGINISGGTTGCTTVGDCSCPGC